MTTAEEMKVDNVNKSGSQRKGGKIIDPCSFANINEVKLTHTHLNLSVLFEEKILRGNVNLSFTVVSDEVSTVILDCRDLNIFKIYETQSKTALQYKFGNGNDAVPTFGKPLEIALSSPTSADFQITIEYETSPKAEAIQWLQPSQTAGKKYLYLFTQCQAIGARTMFPCQDTPAAKNTYSASITVAKPPYIALMSALPDGQPITCETSSAVTYNFKQPIAIASYLVALVVGNLERREIGNRCAVYSEPETVAAAEYEFANTEKMLAIAENICGKFVWGRYDLLMLPPSFPYGGMENPNLTFVTPTLIAGDRSLDNVIAHEITHSWTGNLVTNVTWEHFWLNEGWTRFIENKIMGVLRGKDFQMLDIANSHITLKNAVKKLGAEHEFTKLNLSLLNVDPDDAFSSVPYEKGAEFLRYLECVVGGPELFEQFAKVYLKTYAVHIFFSSKTFSYNNNKCLDSWEFKDFFMHYFTNAVKVNEEKLSAIDWNLWLTQPGLPPIMPVQSILIEQAQALVNKWSAKEYENVSADDIKGWEVQQMEMFLDELLIAFQKQLNDKLVDKQLLRTKLNLMKNVYHFHESKNIEIIFRFNLLALECDLESEYAHVIHILKTVGRMKFVRPLYRSLIKNEERRQMAVDVFQEVKDCYHPICAKMIAQDLKV